MINKDLLRGARSRSRVAPRTQRLARAVLLDDRPASEVAAAEGVTPQAVAKACRQLLQEVLATAQGGDLGVAALLAPPNLLALIRWLERRTLEAGADLSADDVKVVKTVLMARWRAAG